MNIRNEDIEELIAEIPDGHKHLRTMLVLKGRGKISFQEATIANLVRAYITVKTHPLKNKIAMKGKILEPRKAEFAEYQLIEVEK